MTDNSQHEADVQCQKNAFLEAFLMNESIAKASDTIGISKYSHGRWIRDDPKYRESFEDVLKLVKQKWLDEVLLIARTDTVNAKNRLFGYALAINNLEGAQVVAKIPAATQIFLTKILQLGPVHTQVLDSGSPTSQVENDEETSARALGEKNAQAHAGTPAQAGAYTRTYPREPKPRGGPY